MNSSFTDPHAMSSDGSDFDLPVKTTRPAASVRPTLKSTGPKPAKRLAQALDKPSKAGQKKRQKPDSDMENSDIDSDPIDSANGSILSLTPPSAKKQKKAAPPKRAAGKPLEPMCNESYIVQNVSGSKAAKNVSASEQYQRLTQLEHILKRPDTYIGSVERTEKQLWVFNSQTEMMELREVSFVPGLYKIFDEILVNAADNKQRDGSMSEIKVTIDREKGEISVRNDGRGIPIEIHEKEKIYVPELIFGNLLTSSNYDDEEHKVTGGRNGYGAKLCNIFSKEFNLETVDSKKGKKYTQTWTENMSRMATAKITACKIADYTKVTFLPDFSKFGMTGIDDDFEALVKRRVYDMAGTCKGIKVHLNGERIKMQGFKKYMEMYTKAIKTENMVADDASTFDSRVILTDHPNERWEIGFAVSDGSFQQVSFVNSIATTSGGTHVNYVADQIVNKLMETVKKKNKGGVALKNTQIRNHIFLFVNCLITNPAFTSQTKEQLTTKSSQFGSKCVVSEKFLKDIGKTEAVNNILHFAQQKADQVLKKSDGSKRTRMNNSKLVDANKAGTKDGHKCTLILTEGDSASLLAVAGRAVVNPDLFGVFPLRGKLLNVRDASIDQISKNQEIQNIKQFMGLQHKKDYQDTKSLRYGHLMIMTDQDHDGSHIKGLLINFLQVQFPSLLRLPGFLMEFITPIVKVWKGDRKNPKHEQSFFTMPEYEQWKELPGNRKDWKHRYFKGLGTSKPSDAEIYFRDLDKHLKEFHVMKDTEAELIDLAFSKKKADSRKTWLRDFQPGTYLDMSAPKISYDDFVNKELILFSMADNLRSLPSVVDGFKPAQRKILYTCFKRNLTRECKVVAVAGAVSDITAYAYGEASLQQTIIGLAQDFVGSNNVNCLEPDGSFGSRLQGGNDAASARYIYTGLSQLARKVFHKSDEPLLTHNMDDGTPIEPEVYVPIVPMILVNGAEGIGTGWSTSIPSYNPEDIVENLKRRMMGTSKEDMTSMTPWYRGWKGTVEDMGGERFKFTGTIRQTGDNEIEITELPVRVWTQDFKDRLEEIIKAEKTPSFIKDYTEYNTPDRVHFIVKMEDKHMANALAKGLEETFKLIKPVSTSNLVAFDAHGRIHKYDNVLDIMEEFYQVRMKYYEKRKQHLLDESQSELERLSNQSRFIQMIIDGSLTIAKKKKHELVDELRRLKFKPIPKVKDAKKQGEMEPVVDTAANADVDADDDASGDGSDYDYLAGMALWSLTRERVDKLLKQIAERELELDVLIKTSPRQMWVKDLEDFLVEWNCRVDDDAKIAQKRARLGRRASAKLKISGKSGSKKRRSDDSDGGADSEFAVSKPKKKAATNTERKPSTLMSYLTKTDPQSNENSQPTTGGIASTATAGTKSIPASGGPMLAKTQTSVKPRTDVHKRALSTIAPQDDDLDDVFAAVTKEADPLNGSRNVQQRAARGKAAMYVVPDDSDSSGESLVGGLGNMVKGIGHPAKENSRPLFSASASRPGSARPSSSQDRPRSRGLHGRGTIDLSSGPDETDYTKLAPQESPLRPIARSSRPAIAPEDDFQVDRHAAESAKPAGKSTSKKSTASGKAPAVTAKASRDNTKTARKPAAKKAANNPVAGPSAGSKQPTLSPAAKAYAAKKDTAGIATSAATKKLFSVQGATSSKAAGVEALVEEFSSAGETPSPPKAARSAPAAARPSRRAAATTSRARYVISDDDDEVDDDDDDASDSASENGGEDASDDASD